MRGDYVLGKSTQGRRATLVKLAPYSRVAALALRLDILSAFFRTPDDRVEDRERASAELHSIVFKEEYIPTLEF